MGGTLDTMRVSICAPGGRGTNLCAYSGFKASDLDWN